MYNLLRDVTSPIRYPHARLNNPTQCTGGWQSSRSMGLSGSEIESLVQKRNSPTPWSSRGFATVLQTPKHDVETWSVIRLGFPTFFQHPPQTFCEPCTSPSLGFHGAFATHDLRNNGGAFDWGERDLLAENLIYHHSQRIAI